MKIEEAIQQSTPFKNEFQKATVNLLYTYGWLTDKLKSFFSEFDITLKQYNILRILNGAGKPVSTSYLRERLLDRMSDTSRIVDRMCSKGYVIKNLCKNDRRLIDISLTEKGISLLNEIKTREGEMDTMFRHISEKEAEILNDILDKMRD